MQFTLKNSGINFKEYNIVVNGQVIGTAMNQWKWFVKFTVNGVEYKKAGLTKKNAVKFIKEKLANN